MQKTPYYARNNELFDKLTSIENTSKMKRSSLEDEVKLFMDWWIPTGHPIIEYDILNKLYDNVLTVNMNTFTELTKNRIVEFSKALLAASLNTYKNPKSMINPTTGKPYSPDVQYNNFQSIRIYIVCFLAAMLQDGNSIDWVHTHLLQQLHDNLNDDGSSYDLQHRDSLLYHVYNIRPLLKTAIILNKTDKYKAFDYYNFTTKSSNSLKSAIHLLTPYIMGDKSHRMLVNSQLASDVNSTNYNKLWNKDDAKWLIKDAALMDSEMQVLYHNIWISKKITS